MKLIMHKKADGALLPSYTIVDVSAADLGYIQLALISLDQSDLRVDQDWVAKPIPDPSRYIPAEEAYHRHQENDV